MASPSSTVVFIGPPMADPNALPSVGGALCRDRPARTGDKRRQAKKVFVLRRMVEEGQGGAG